MGVVADEVFGDFAGAGSDVVSCVLRRGMRGVVVVDDIVEGLAVDWSGGDIGIPEFMIGDATFQKSSESLSFP